jgi:hypothetical protein
MGYYIDLETISLDDYRTKLATAYLPPSRMLLKERMDERFACFKSMGINNVKALLKVLKKKDQLLALAKEDCFTEEYLTILLREINSTLPKPNRIAEFQGISKDVADRLESLGLNNSEKLYEKVLSKAERFELAAKTGISDQVILELTKLCDLSRIKWVGVTFARMLYELGTDNVEKVAAADPIALHAAINRLNKERNIYNGQIGLNDIRILVNEAKSIPPEIEF